MTEWEEGFENLTQIGKGGGGDAVITGLIQ